MEVIKKTNKKTERTYRTYRWGIRFMYLVAFSLYTYFMNFDKLFASSWQPFMIASLAFFLLVPLMVLPADVWLRFRIWSFAVKQSLFTGYFPTGGQMALTPDGKLLSFITETTWKIKATGGVYEKGFIQSMPAPKEAVKLHKEMQEHLAWSRIVLAESKTLNAWFWLFNIILLSVPAVHTELISEAGSSLSYILFMSTIWLIFLSQSQGLLIYLLHLRKKAIVSFVEDSEDVEDVETCYAILDRDKVTSIVLANAGKGFEVKDTIVTLNGGLLLTLQRKDSIVEYIVIDSRK